MITKKYVVLGLVILGIVMVVWVVWWIINNNWNGKNDVRIGIIADNGLALINLSSKRKIINYLTVDPEVEVWIPRGLGWYRAGRVKKIMETEKKQELANELFFYNFGFFPEKVIRLSNKENTNSNRFWMKELGGLGFVRWWFGRDSYMTKREEIKRSLVGEGAILDEIMMRDFADTRLIESEFRLSVVNGSEVQGLANFLSQKLGWEGYTINSIENIEKVSEKCIVNINNSKKNDILLMELKKILSQCDFRIIEDLGTNEVEIILGEGYGQMLNYNNYIR